MCVCLVSCIGLHDAFFIFSTFSVFSLNAFGFLLLRVWKVRLSFILILALRPSISLLFFTHLFILYISTDENIVEKQKKPDGTKTFQSHHLFIGFSFKEMLFDRHSARLLLCITPSGVFEHFSTKGINHELVDTVSRAQVITGANYTIKEIISFVKQANSPNG